MNYDSDCTMLVLQLMRVTIHQSKGFHNFLKIAFITYKPIRHNIMTICWIVCWSPCCGQNNSDLLTHGLHSMKMLCSIWHQDVTDTTADLLSPVNCDVEPLWFGLVSPMYPPDADWIEIWGNWRQNKHLKLVNVLLKPFLNLFFFVVQPIILLKEATANRNTISMKGFIFPATMLR